MQKVRFYSFLVPIKPLMILDARGGHLHSPGEDHAGVPDAGDVQAQHG